MSRANFVVLLCIINTIGAQYDLGDPCLFDESRNIGGVCEIVQKCEYAQKRLYEDERKVPTCGWLKNERIVCCPNDDLLHQTGAFRNIFLGTREGVLRNDKMSCRYDGKVPMLCCPLQPFQPQPPEPHECPALHTPEPPPLPTLAHRVAWQECVNYERYVRICEQDEQDLSKFRRGWECGAALNEQRISEGQIVASPKEFPHMAVLGCQNTKKNQEKGDEADIVWIGGGSLISDQYILTAGHVLIEKSLGSIRYALLGAVDKTDLRNGQLYPIISLVPYKTYVNLEKHDDIALVKLGRQVIFSQFIRPACLPVPGLVDPSDPIRIVAGWGRTGAHHDTSKTLLKAYVKKVELGICQRSLQSDVWDARTMICATGLKTHHNMTTDTCEGDSGGPLMTLSTDKNLECHYIVHGVVSWGPNCGTGAPGVYTRVEPYMKWIAETVWPEQMGLS